MKDYTMRATLLVSILFITSLRLWASVVVTQPSTLSLCQGQDYQQLGDIVIAEGSNNDFEGGADGFYSYRIKCPSGFEFQSDSGSVLVHLGTALTIEDIAISVSTVTIFYSLSGNSSSWMGSL